MEHQVSNTGPTRIRVFAPDGSYTDLEPGAVWIGRLWRINNVLDGRAAYSVEPVETKSQ